MTLRERFDAKWIPEPTTGCWLWIGAANANGYGILWAPRLGRCDGAHRIAWELEHEPVPAGLEIDHLCHTPACVNPTHLRLATRRENARGRRACRKPGHEHDPKYPRCRTCTLARGRAWRAA